MSTYYLGTSKLRIKVINLYDPNLNIESSRSVNVKTLKQFVQSLDRCTMYVTSTMPNIFLYLQVDDSKSQTYNLPYRVFLGFVAGLISEDETKIDWLTYGF